MAAAIGMVLLVFATTVTLATIQARYRIREQIAGRDGEVLYAVMLMYYAQEVKDGISEPITNPADQLSLVVRSALQLKGVIGVRIFDAGGSHLESFPVQLAEASIPEQRLAHLRALRPFSRFHPRTRMSELFLDEESSEEIQPVLEVNVPLHTPGGPLAGVAQFLLEGQSITTEYARLDHHLALQTGVALLAGGAALTAALGWAFRGLRRAHRLVAQRTEDLLRANQELALAAKTSALGTITAHLIHGLKNPLAGLHNYVNSLPAATDAGGESDWHQALSSARRMQSLINETVGVLREQQGGAAFEITTDELAHMVRARVEPLCRERGVVFTTRIERESSLPNRVANLVALILVNLIENAIQASLPSQTVTLRVSREATGPQFEVSDQGPGIPSSVPLFMPCHSSKEGGTGLGLALCRQLVNHLGAELRLVRNRPGDCCFKLLVPVSVESSVTLAAAP